MEGESEKERSVMQSKNPWESNPVPVWKNERPISNEEEAMFLLKKKIDGESINRIEILPDGKTVIRIYVIEGWPEYITEIQQYHLDKAVLDSLSSKDLLIEMPGDSSTSTNRNWQLKK